MSEKLIVVILGLCLIGGYVFGDPNAPNDNACENCTDNSTRILITYQLYLGKGEYQSSKVLIDLNLKPSKEIHLFIPGDYSPNYYAFIKEALHKAYDSMNFNYIFVEWTTKIKGIEYTSSQKKMQLGKTIGSDLFNLKTQKKREVDRIAAQGRGSILVSSIPQTYKAKLKRIILLDPFSDFLKIPTPERITKDSVEVLEVVHTTSNEFGFSKPVGHRDFYPNGGLSPQPDCPKNQSHYYCSTRISVIYYLRALEGRKQGCFTGKNCSDFQSYLNGGCDRDVAASLYNNLPNTITGTFYLTTV